MWRNAGEALYGWARAALRFDAVDQVRHEMMLWYFAGYIAARYEKTAPAGQYSRAGDC